jgi:hypothetical protein
VVAVDNNNNNSEGILVNGIMTVTNTPLLRTGTGVTSFLQVNGGGSLQANYCSMRWSSLTLNNSSTDTLAGDAIYGVFTINSGAAIAIENNDFSNLGKQDCIAVGDPTATINLVNNYWGTTVASQIAITILDHADDATRPTILYTPFLNTLVPNQPPVLASIPNQVVNEGSMDTFTASATDSDGDTLTYTLDPGAPAGASINNSTGVFTFTPQLGPAKYTITVRVTDSGSPPLSAVQSFTLTVNNVAPVATLTGPTDGFNGVRGQVRTFTVGALEPTAADEAQGFTYNINWGDGSANTSVSGPSGTTVSHIFNATGTDTITATATNAEGGVSAPVTVSDAISAVELQNGTLAVGGTPANDTIVLAPGAAPNSLSVTLNGTSSGPFTTTGQCQVFGDGGSGDVLTFNDSADTLADQYTITSSTVGRTNAATITFSLTGTVNLDSGTSSDTINVQSTAAGTPVSITLGKGVNRINVGSPSQTLDSVQGPLTVAVAAGVTPASNSLYLLDQGSSASETYTIAATTVNRSGMAPITYSGLKKLVLDGSSGTDLVTIVNTATATPVAITGGGGTTTLLGPNTNSTFTLTGPNTGTVGNVTFSGVANLTGGTGNDTFTFNAAGSLSGTVNGGDGSNKLNYANYGAAVTVSLPTGTAPATGGFVNIQSVTGSNSLGNTLIGANTPNTWSITGVNAGTVSGIGFTAFANLTGGIDTDVFKFSNGKYVSGVINGGGGGAWLDYSAYTTAVTVNLATGAATGVNGGVQNIQNVRAGSGGSTLTGNALGNILLGGTGPSTMVGGSGRSLLIGGHGLDSILGGSGNDIIIGAYTTYDASNAALMSILAEWQRTDETYAQRIANIKTGGGLNMTNDLVYGTTVKDPGASDTLTGGSGGMNWYFKGAHDTITDLQSGEQVN